MKKNYFSMFSLLPQYLETQHHNALENMIERILTRDKTFDKVLIFDESMHSVHISGRPAILKPILEKYLHIPGSNSMLLRDKKDLFFHISRIYSLSQSHYVWGKNVNLGGNFPRQCCNVSSTNLQYSFLDNGYTNVTKFSDFLFLHAFLAFPFILNDTYEKGFVILDPTSDQPSESRGENMPKNYLRVVSEREMCELRGWDSYFPSETTTFSNLEVLRCDSTKSSESLDYYFNEVFKNPISVSNLLE